MFNFLCKSVFNGVKVSVSRKNYRFYSLSVLSSNPSSDDADNKKLFAISYLINSCGLSPESAQSATKYLCFESSRNPDSVIDFFQKNGFSKTQITTLVKRFPRVLTTNTEKTLLPKLEFLRSTGFTGEKLTRTLTCYPRMFQYSMKKQIIPSFKFLCDFLKSEAKACMVLQRYLCILFIPIERHVVSNINTLRESGVADSSISSLLEYQPRMFVIQEDKLKKIVQKVEKMGFDPKQVNFVRAIKAFSSMKESTREKKFNVYKSWGCSKSQILEAFKKDPSCLMVSEDKIMSIMDLVVNKLGMKTSVVADQPGIFTYSVKKRFIPRVSVAQVLLSKGLIKKNFSLLTLIICTENKFLDKFVNRHGEEAPHLLILYRKKLRLAQKPGIADDSTKT